MAKLSTADKFAIADAFQAAVEQYAAIVSNDSGVPLFPAVECLRSVRGLTLGAIVDELSRVSKARGMCIHIGIQDEEIAFFVHE